MPNWKKVIVSGSDAVLNSVNATTALTASGLIYPTVDGTANQVIQTDGLGNLSFGSVDTIYELVKNVSGTTLYKGTPVHATGSGTSGNLVGVIAASASNPATMPATLVLNEDLADGDEGYAIISGLIQGVDTSAFESGQVIYVGENSGYTNVKPTGSNLIQNLGIVTKIHPSNGAGVVLGAGRSNDVPNLLNGEVFWGEGNRAIKKPLAHILSGSSYTYSGSFSGSFEGDGSGLTGISVDITSITGSQFFTYNFISTGSVTVTHNLNSQYPLVQVYDVNDTQIIPQSIESISVNSTKVSFGSLESGTIIISKGGDVIGTYSPIISTYGDSDVLSYLTTGVGGHILPSTTETYDLGSPTNKWRDLYLSGSTIYLGDTKLSTGESGSLQVRDLDDNVLPIIARSVNIGSGNDLVQIKRDPIRGTVKFVESSIDQSGTLVASTNVVIGTYSGSFTGSFIGDGSQLSGVTSYTDADTLSYINSIGVVSGSVNWDTLSGRPNGIISSSAQLSNQTVPGNFTVGGIFTAQEFHTEFVSASIIYQSGSTQFGNSYDDVHTFVGTISATTIQNVISSSAQVDYNSIQNQPIIPTNNNQLTNGAGYCTTDTTYTANEMLTCVKTVDGTGSGLDADLLDGQQGSYYLDYNNFTNKPTIPTNNNQLTNGAGYTTCTGTVSSWEGIPAGTRCNYTLKFQPPASNFAGFQFLTSGASNAGYFLVRGTTDNGNTWKAEGISLTADTGWLTLAQRYTSGRGVRILSNDIERLVVDFDGTVRPGANGTQNLGSSTLRWNTVYTSDLSLKNDVGDWTIVEGEEDLFLYNNKKDKVYKFNLTEVDKESAPKKRS